MVFIKIVIDSPFCCVFLVMENFSLPVIPNRSTFGWGWLGGSFMGQDLRGPESSKDLFVAAEAPANPCV